jgi:hypothetical protein
MIFVCFWRTWTVRAQSNPRAFYGTSGRAVTKDKVLTEAGVRELEHAGIAFAITSGRSPRGMSMLIEPVDQGFEHRPARSARSFAPNPLAYNPLYHFELAIEAGCNAHATRPLSSGSVCTGRSRRWVTTFALSRQPRADA